MSQSTIKIASAERFDFIKTPLMAYEEYNDGLGITLAYSKSLEDWLNGFAEDDCFHLFIFTFEFSPNAPDMEFTGYITATAVDHQGLHIKLKLNSKTDIH